MKKKISAIFIALVIFAIAPTTSAKVYYTRSSTVLYDEDGISQSASSTYSPIGGSIKFDTINILSDDAEVQKQSFAGAVYDGDNIWLVPYSADSIIKVTTDGQTTSIPFPEEYKNVDAAFYGGAFDGRKVYFAPYNADGVMTIDIESSTPSFSTKWPEGFDKSKVKFKGATFDGDKIWFSPADGGVAVTISEEENYSSFSISQGTVQNEFAGVIYTDGRVLFIPDTADSIVMLNVQTGALESFDSWPTGFDKNKNKFNSAIYDGSYTYLIPSNNQNLIKFENATGKMNEIPLSVSEGTRYAGGSFDGRNIWLTPFSGTEVLKYDTANNVYDKYTTDKNATDTYIGGFFDGNSAYLIPHNAKNIIKISGDNTPPTAMNVFLSTTTGVSVSGEMVASDPDTDDSIVFSIVSAPGLGTVEINGTEGNFTYTPTSNETGTDTFTYKANDGNNDSNIATVTITISEPEAPPAETTGKYIDLWDHWGEKYAESLTNMEVMLGENVDGFYYFYPDYLLTRAGFMVLANSAFGFEGDINDKTLPFVDIEDSPKWIIKAASAAYHGNMIHGVLVGDTVELCPLEKLTRLEAMITLANVINPAPAKDEVLDFVDSNTIPDWAVDSLKSLKKIGLLSGYDDNTIKPFNTVSRIEAAKMLYEALSYMNGNTASPLILK